MQIKFGFFYFFTAKKVSIELDEETLFIAL